MIRFYVLPIAIDPVMGRHPKYVSMNDGADGWLVLTRWGMFDYGLIDAALLCANVTQEQHEILAAEPDVAAVPENIDGNISEVALPKVVSVLEALRVPAGWVDTTYTYRQILRMFGGLCQFAQRHNGLHGERLIDSQAQLDLRWNQIPADRQQRIIATADSFGYDYSEITNQWLIRQILKHLADQWGDTPLYIAGQEL